MNKTRPAVMHLISGLITGGAEQAMLRLIQHGLAETFDTHVVSMSDEGTFGSRLREAGAAVHTLKMTKNPLPALGRLRTIVRTVKPSIAQGWMYHGNLAALTIGLLAGEKVPVLWNIRQGLDGLETEKLSTRHVIRANRLLSRLPAHILYNSQRSRQEHEAFGFATHTGQVIPNGFDLDQFSADHQLRQVVRNGLGVADDTPLVGHFARFHPMKDHAGLLRAANMAFQRGLDAHFLMTGRGVSAQAISLDRLVDPEFHDRFHIFAERSDVPAMMQAIDFYVSSSVTSEGFPNVIGEAMASRRPCIGTDIGDTAYVIGKAGIVVPPGDTAALADAMVRLGTDPSLRQALGESARRLIEEQFDIEQAVDRYLNLYQSVLAGGRGN